MPQPIDYNAWAATYDASRRASPQLVAAIRDLLGPVRQRRLLDIGSGTGNLALPLGEAGFRVVLCDLALSMLQQAARKLPARHGLTVAAAERLPYRSGVFDGAICINVVRHLADRPAAFAEARRVLRAGPLIIRTTTQETEQAHWAHAYFPTLASHQPPVPAETALVAELETAGFARVRLQRFWYGDAGLDGSFQALKYQPHALLARAVTGNIAVFKRLPADAFAEGLEHLRADLERGRFAQVSAAYQPALDTYGDGVLVAAYTDSADVLR